MHSDSERSRFFPAKVTDRSLMFNVILFGETLRSAGCKVSLAEILDAANAILKIDIFDRSLFYYTLRSTLVKNESFFLKFDLLFRQFWSGERRQNILKPRVAELPKLEESGGGGKSSLDVSSPAVKEKEDEQVSKNLSLYSATERKSFKQLDEVILQDKIRLMKRLVKKFKRRLATLPGRRKVPASTGAVDLRRSIRRAISKGGSPIVLVKSEKKIVRSKLIVLADISGSMQNQSDDIFLLLYLFKNVARNSEIFVFSTKLLRLSNITSFGNLRDASQAISSRVSIWGSGTRIGECLHSFLSHYHNMVDGKSTVLIISDGWDLGDSETLRMAMSELRQKISQIVWLNPLIKTKGYEPICIGMKTALEFVDVFAPTDIFLDKKTFESYLGKEMGPLFPRSKTTLAT